MPIQSNKQFNQFLSLTVGQPLIFNGLIFNFQIHQKKIHFRYQYYLLYVQQQQFFKIILK